MQQIILNGDIGFEITLANIMGAVKLYPNEDIEFIVSTYGGFVDEAYRIYDYLETQTNVSVIFKDICASAGTFAFLSIPLEKRKAYNNTQFAIHLPYNSYMFENMNVEDLEKEAENLQQYTDKVNAIYEKQLNITNEEINLLMSPDSFFNEVSAMGFQFISEVVKLPKEKEQNKELLNKGITQNRICAFVNKDKTKIKNKIKMEKIEKLEKDMAENKSLLEKVLAFFKQNVKNLMISSEEGVDLEFSNEVVEVGSKVTAPDGDYTIMYNELKYTITILNNEITAMVEVIADEPENTELADLKAENETLKTKIAELEKTQNKIVELETKFTELQNLQTKAQNFLKDKEGMTNEKPLSYVERRQKVLSIKN